MPPRYLIQSHFDKGVAPDYEKKCSLFFKDLIYKVQLNFTEL